MRYFIVTRMVAAAAIMGLASLLPAPIRVDTEPIPPAVQQYEVGEVIRLEVR